jgi:hypothetical protein
MKNFLGVLVGAVIEGVNESAGKSNVPCSAEEG